jgi:1-acyl-sn-glycerol-3-phosphate acyltransferase
MRRIVFTTPVIGTILKWAGVCALRMCGWRLDGALPDLPKYVIVLAPHTSNWDFPVGLAFALWLRVEALWMGKDGMFRFPFYWLFWWLGGIPIDRDHHHGLVGQVIGLFNANERFILALAPEGHRRRVDAWKTGFYRIAHGAGVPIVLTYLDYRRKVGGIGPAVMPTGDIDADMKVIQEFYSTVTARHPEFTGPVWPPAQGPA